MIRAMTLTNARKVWKRYPERMIAFAPQEYRTSIVGLPSNVWILADSHGMLGMGSSREDLDDLRSQIKRKA